MIKGIGTDVVAIERITLEEAFVKRILTTEEQQLFFDITNTERRQDFLAGRFAAKEALMKALGTGIGRSSFQDFNIIPNEYGQPLCTIPGVQVHLSISHDAGVAVAVAVIEHDH